MPLLLLIFIILIIRSLTLPGSFEGVKYLLVPRWENLFKIDTWVMALGQAFSQFPLMDAVWLFMVVI